MFGLVKLHPLEQVWQNCSLGLYAI